MTFEQPPHLVHDRLIGDAERVQVARNLEQHQGAGRLTAAELDHRVQAALSARTLGELQTLTRDLPPVRGAGPTAGLRALDLILGLIALAAFWCLIGLFAVAGPSYFVFGFFACLGAGTIAAAITHFVHRLASD